MKYIEKKHEIISYLYQLRVLTYYEIYDYIFKPEGLADSYCQKILTEMVKDGLIEKNGLRKNESYYYATMKGLNILKTCGLKLIGSDEVVEASTLLPAFKVKIHDRLVNHQTSLNHFVLEYKARSEESFSYYDEKDVSKLFPGARPDGLIREKNRILFLEMDMNTEDKKALNKKWENYRTLFKSEQFYNMKESATILFILGGNLSDKSNRCSFLRKQIDDNLGDFLSQKLNAVINTEENLLNTICSKQNKDLINRFKELGYNIYKGSTNQESLSGYEFDLYINKTDDTGNILNYQGIYDEYLIDDMTDGNIYSFRKICNYESILSRFSFLHKRDLKYLVITESETDAFRIAKDAGNYSNFIYYTTPSRLFSLPLYEAVFQVNQMGDKWHFEGSDLRIQVEEEKILIK